MNNRICLIFLMLCITLLSYGYGLGFYDSGNPIAARTTYSVLANQDCRFNSRFILSFEMAVNSPVEIGYVCRIKTSSSGDSGIYNLFFDLRGEDYLFRFNEEGKTVLISLPRNKKEITRDHWFDVRIDIDLKSKEISLDIDGEKRTVKVKTMPSSFEPEIVFGKSDYLLDVPSMAINNVRIEGDESFHFPLNESEGNSVSDSDGVKAGAVENPIWLINSAYHWQKDFKISSSRRAGRAYDPLTHRFFFITTDSIHIFDTGSKKSKSKALAEKCPVQLFLANCFFNPDDNRVYIYEVFPKDGGSGPMMASLDTETLTWKVEMERPLGMQLHHHDYIYNKDKGEHIIFGGFGNQYYSNSFYRYIPGMEEWERVDSISGDRISPRYFTATGKSPSGRYIYIFGGMGNDSGDQIVGRRYFYDLHRLNLSTGKVEKLWESDHKGTNVVPARGMAVVGDSTFFVLCYPESRSMSHLKLYEYSIADGTNKVLADSIPIKSDKINTNARLYHDASQGKFYVVVEETDDDVASDLTVYSLSYPPVSYEGFVTMQSPGNRLRLWYLWVALAFIVAAGVGVWLYIIRKKKTPEDGNTGYCEEGGLEKEDILPEKSERGPDAGRSDSIYLFGRFTAVDSRGMDVSHMFTSRLRSIVGLLFQYNEGDGIHTSLLGELIWPDKDKTKVKNSRGVAINSLRKILADFNDVSLVYENKSFRLVSGPGFYCDYLRCMELISDEKKLAANRKEFLEILSRGRFLKDFPDSMFDDFKRKVEPLLEVAISHQIQATYAGGQFEECVRFVETEFNIDPVNEEALLYGIKALLKTGQEKKARRMYRTYEEEYLKTTGESLPKPFEHFRE